jgi:hypothetical protein
MIGEIGFRPGEEREAGKGESRKLYLIFCLEQKIRKINFVVLKENNVL